MLADGGYRGKKQKSALKNEAFFAILALECSPVKARKILNKLRSLFESAGVQVTIGYMARNRKAGLEKTWEIAKEALRRETEAIKLKQRMIND